MSRTFSSSSREQRTGRLLVKSGDALKQLFGLKGLQLGRGVHSFFILSQNTSIACEREDHNRMDTIEETSEARLAKMPVAQLQELCQKEAWNTKGPGQMLPGSSNSTSSKISSEGEATKKRRSTKRSKMVSK